MNALLPRKNPGWVLALSFFTVIGVNLRGAENVLYLHSVSTNTFLGTNSPTGTNFQTSSSTTVDRTNFVEVGTWSMAPSPVFFDLAGIGDLSVWLGRKFADPNGNSDNSENTGTFFDLRAEILRNGAPIPGAVGVVTFLRNVKADPDKANQVVIPFGAVNNARFSRSDVLSLRISAKVSEFSGQPDAPGASIFFDSVERPAGFGLSYYVVPEISIDSTTVAEGNSGTTDAVLTVNLSVPAERAVSVDYATADGTATLADSDYVTASGPLSFAPGETSKSITLQVLGDTRREPDETFFVNLSNPVYGVVSLGVGTVTITNDDLVPIVTVLSPQSGLVTNSTSVEVRGTTSPNNEVRIEGGAGTVKTIADTGGSFSIVVPLQTNRLNHLFAIATDQTGTPSAPQPLDITQDLQPPSLFIDFPLANAELAADTIDVAGRVGDLLSGFMGLTVTVNGQPAIVDVGIGNNGTFVRGNVPLALGTNLVIATATDIAGNSILRQIAVKRVPITGARMVAVSGNGQTTNVHRLLLNPIDVQVTETNGAPFANKLVTFSVIRSDGRLSAEPFGAAAMILQTHTDSGGLARAYWRLGGDAGCGNNRVEVTSKDIAGSIFFCASAKPALPSQINIGSGNNQKAEVGGPANEPLRAWVNDSCNGVPNIAVTFTVLEGGGKVNGLGSVTVVSANTGHAQVNLTLGPDPGKNVIEANFPGNPGNPATFIVYGLMRDVTKPTSFTGLILDNASQPIGGAICSLTVGGVTLMASSDAQGQFIFPNTPSGRGDLFVNGLTANSLGGNFISPNSFPFLSYSVTLVPSTENSLPTPVLLPRLNPNNNVLYRGTNDLVLTCEGIAGLKMTIKANSMRKANGSLVTPSNPAVVSLNQVKHDKVPMPIPDGAAPPFTWTLQPARSTFDPPIQIEYPNMSGLPAGGIAFFLSFNHDTEKFEIIASGHVVADGSTIVTDPGGGLNLAGWGCNCPPYSVTANCENCNVAISGADRVCKGEPVTFSATGSSGGSYAWSGGTPVSGRNSSSYTATFDSEGNASVSVTHTCTTPQAGSVSDSKTVEVLVDGKDLGFVQLNFGIPNKLLDRINEAAKKISIGEINASASVGFAGSAKAVCCTIDGIRTAQKQYAGNVNLQAGVTLLGQAGIPGASLPGPFATGLFVFVEGGVNGSINGTFEWDRCKGGWLPGGKASGTISGTFTVGVRVLLASFEIARGGGQSGVSGTVDITPFGKSLLANGCWQHNGVVVFIQASYLDDMGGEIANLNGGYVLIQPGQCGSFSQVINTSL